MSGDSMKPQDIPFGAFFRYSYCSGCICQIIEKRAYYHVKLYDKNLNYLCDKEYQLTNGIISLIDEAELIELKAGAL